MGQLRTACKNGHPYPENAYVRGNGHRFCKKCGVENATKMRRRMGILPPGERKKYSRPRPTVPPNTDEVGYIPLTHGRYATVDIADYDFLMQWNWQAVRHSDLWYAVRTEDKKRVSMHGVVLGMSHIDHVDHDGLNNRRVNLRPATTQQNNQNTRLYRNSTTGFKGVTMDHGKARARIHVDGKAIYLGCFGSKEQAARAYDDAARLHFGGFACPNL
jgi:hypothetical protein